MTILQNQSLELVTIVIVVNFLIGGLGSVTVRLHVSDCTVRLQLCTLISNSNWIEWSNPACMISKSDYRAARGWFEITSTITPWIVRLINRIYKSFGIKNIFQELLLSKNVCSPFRKLWNCEERCRCRYTKG